MTSARAGQDVALTCAVLRDISSRPPWDLDALARHNVAAFASDDVLVSSHARGGGAGGGGADERGASSAQFWRLDSRENGSRMRVLMKRDFHAHATPAAALAESEEDSDDEASAAAAAEAAAAEAAVCCETPHVNDRSSLVTAEDVADASTEGASAPAPPATPEAAGGDGDVGLDTRGGGDGGGGRAGEEGARDSGEDEPGGWELLDEPRAPHVGSPAFYATTAQLVRGCGRPRAGTPRCCCCCAWGAPLLYRWRCLSEACAAHPMHFFNCAVV